MGAFFLDPEDVRSLSLGAVWNFMKGTGFHDLDISFKGHKGPVKKAYMGLNPFNVPFCSVPLVTACYLEVH